MDIFIITVSNNFELYKKIIENNKYINDKRISLVKYDNSIDNKYLQKNIMIL